MGEGFNSRLDFVMASVGAAVGLGNLFRFPALAVKYGGVFIPAYILLLVILGLPLLYCELAVGRRQGSSAAVCMGSVSKRLAPIGWAASVNAFIIMCYYGVLFSYVLLAAVFSYRLADPLVEPYRVFTDYISPDGGFFGDTQLFLAAAVAAVLLCYGRADRLGKISTVSVIFSVAVIALLAVIRGASCPEAMLSFLRLEPSHLLTAAFWADAAGQVFFSLSVGAGVMFTYGAFLPKGAKIAPLGGIIALMDLLVSLAATVIYASVVEKGEETALLTCFSVYPKAFTEAFGGLSAPISFLFYISVALLCLSSVFAYLKSAAATAGSPKNEGRRALLLSLAAAGVGLIMLTRRGQGLLYFADDLAARYLTLAVGLGEFLAFGFGLPPELLALDIWGTPKGGRLFSLTLRFLCPALLLFLIFTP